MIAAVGAGRMGRGIALAFAYAGRPVTIVDIKPRTAAAFASLEADARAEIGRDLAFLVRAGLIDEAAATAAAARVTVVDAPDAAGAIGAAAVVFEGVPEVLEVKREALAMIGDHAAPDALVVSTTSTMSADILAEFVPDPGRFLNAHWLNPAHLMPLVEVSPCAATRPEAQATLLALLRAVGKVPVVCRSSPGFIVPRIQALAMNEAARMVEEGVASAEDIDTAVRVGFGLRFAVLGLLEFIDWGGGDILHHASALLSNEIDPVRFAAPEVIERNLREGRSGLRDGRGFYDYAGVDTAAYRDERMMGFVDLLRLRGLLPKAAGD